MRPRPRQRRTGYVSVARNTKGGGRLPPNHQPDPDGPVHKVDHVTSKNRNLTHIPDDEIIVALYDADLSKLVEKVYIPRTREMPDCVTYHGKLYVFHDTEQSPPQYTLAMIADGTYHSKAGFEPLPLTKGKDDEPT